MPNGNNFPLDFFNAFAIEGTKTPKPIIFPRLSLTETIYFKLTIGI